MAGGTKPSAGARKAEKFKDGLKKSGGVNTQKHAGPGRASKTPHWRQGLAIAKTTTAMTTTIGTELADA